MSNYNIDTLAEIILSELDKLNKNSDKLYSLFSSIEEKKSNKEESEKNNPKSEILIPEEIKINTQPMEKLMQSHVNKLEFFTTMLLNKQKEIIPKWIITYCITLSIALIITLLIILN